MMKEQIEQKLKKYFSHLHLEVINESSNHNVPPGSESHFKVVVVSETFQGKTRVARHRLVNEVLSEELKIIHALAIHPMSPSDWEKTQGAVSDSPQCAGGSKEK